MVDKFARKRLLEIWHQAAPSVDFREPHSHPRLILTATDLISRYLRMRFTGLYKDLWVRKPLEMIESRVFISEPHAYSPHDWRGTFDSDMVIIGVEEPGGSDGFRVFIEDDMGLGVRFHGLKPIAYGPRDFDERVYLVNKEWAESGVYGTIPIMQALLLLLENAKNLKFEIVQLSLSGHKII